MASCQSHGPKLVGKNGLYRAAVNAWEPLDELLNRSAVLQVFE